MTSGPPIPTPEPGRAPEQRPGFFSLRVRFGPIITLLLAAACLPAWLALGARWHWLLELVTHFAWQYTLAAPVVFALAAWRRQRAIAALAALTFLLGASRLAPLYTPAAPTPPPGSSTLRVATINVLTDNRRYDEVLRLVEAEDPAVLVLLEVDLGWVEAMAPLESKYPLHRTHPPLDNFGIALYTRLETEEIQLQEFGGDVPSIVARVRWQDRPVTVVGSHPLPPGSARKAAIRNEQLAAIGGFVANEPSPAIVMGDLNTTPFSPYFHDLLRRGGLVDSNRGRGFRATWTGGGRLLGVPIDHVLHTPGLAVLSRRVAPVAGSDHRAVIVDFAAAVEQP